MGFVSILFLSLVIPIVVIFLDGVSTRLATGSPTFFSQLETRTGWLLPLAAFFGSVGGLVSVMQRIKSAQSADVKSLEVLPAWPMALAPVVGAIGGVLACLLFKSELLTGSLFPTFTSGVQPDLANPEFFKLMVWAFVAGFSEKLVPDTLDWLASNAIPDKSETPAKSFVAHLDSGLGNLHKKTRIKRPNRNNDKPQNGQTTERPLH